MHDSTFHLGMHIKCSSGTRIVNMLDHLPPMPLVVQYFHVNTEQDELGLSHALRLHDRVRHIELHLSPSALQNFLVLMDTHFPILERLSITLWPLGEQATALILPGAFLAPNLRQLDLPCLGLPKRLRLLTWTVSVVTLQLRNIPASSYFRPRLLVARLSSLPHLEDLAIGFSTPILRPSTERELLGKQGAPITLLKLKTLEFQGVSAYLECLVAQIRIPLLERLNITLFNQIAFALPHLSYLINTTEKFKYSTAKADMLFEQIVSIMVFEDDPGTEEDYPSYFYLSVRCKQLDWQIDCAGQLCSALIPVLSGVKDLRLQLAPTGKILPIEWQNGEIDSTAWHELLRSLIAVKELYIESGFLVELSRALQVDEIGLDPGFLPDLQQILATKNMFASFIGTRRVVGRPIRFSQQLPRRLQNHVTFDV